MLEIFIITYNRESHLKRTLEQLSTSPIKDLPITILDNCSDYDVEKLVSEFKFKNLKLIRNNRNIGGNANIVKAFTEAKAGYVWVLCDDDEYNWKNWGEIEKAFSLSPDVICVNRCGNNIPNLFYNSTFVPFNIYKTSLLTPTVIENMFCNIQNLFPHLAIIASVINKQLSICVSKRDTIKRGTAHDNNASYLRGLDGDLKPSRCNMFWYAGYLNSLELIDNESMRQFIFENSTHCCNSIFELFVHKLWINKTYYNNSFKNIFDMFYNIPSTYYKMFYILAYVFAYFRHKNNKYFPASIETSRDYLKARDIIKKLYKLKKKHKKIVFFGVGQIIGALIEENFDFSSVAICDSNIESGEMQIGNGEAVTTVSIMDLWRYNPDCIVITTHEMHKAREIFCRYRILTEVKEIGVM